MSEKGNAEKGPGGFVAVIYARNLTEAEFYKGLLDSNDIPAIIEDAASEVIGMPESIVGKGVPVLVPDEMLDEASEVLAEHGETEEDDQLEEFEDNDQFEGEEIEDVDDEIDEFDDDDDLDDDLDDDIDELDEFEDDDDDIFDDDDDEDEDRD